MSSRFTISPDASVDDICNAALQCYQRHDDEVAAELARTVLRKDPGHGVALTLIALTLVKRGRHRPAALDYARRALEAAPGRMIAHCAMGQACRDLGLLQEAVGHFRNAVKLDPNNGEILRQLGMALVQAGHFREGWAYYERRPTSLYANQYQRPDPPGAPEWGGEDLTGRTLVLLGENGHGDQIQSLRFVGNLLALPLKQLVICVRPALVRLVENSLGQLPGGDRAYILHDSKVDGIDYKVATESLAHRFNADEASLPGRVPYLFAPPGAPSARRRPRVGIVWRGERHLITNAVRSIPLADWKALLAAHPATAWVSLQHDDHDPGELELLAQHGVETPIRSEFDYLETAKVISGLDLVISVDTSVAHLTGAMGRPVWLLNRASSEWRWGWKPQKSPWYPTMRIFNQETLFEWLPVLDEVGTALRDLPDPS